MIRKVVKCGSFVGILWSLTVPGAVQFPGTKQWELDLRRPITLPPALGADGTIYCTLAGIDLAAVKPDGALKWPAHSGLWNVTSVSLGQDDVVYANGTIGYMGRPDPDPVKILLHAISPDGSIRWISRYPWRYSFLHPYVTPAISPDGSLYIGESSEFGRASVFSLDKGAQIQWEFPIERTSTIGGLLVAPGGTIYILFTELFSTSIRILALNPDGTERWRFAPPGISHFLGAAVGPEGSLYYGATWLSPPPSPNDFWQNHGAVFCITTNGSMKWISETQGGIASSLVIDSGGGAYFATSDKKLHALDSDGKQKWEFQTDNEIVTAAAVAANGEVYFCTKDNRLYAILPNGTLRWTYQTEVGPLLAPIIGGDRKIYLAAGSKLYAINGGSPPADKGWPMIRGDARHSGAVARPAPVPEPPSGVQVSRNRYGVEIQWQTAANASTYEVWRSGSNDSGKAVPVAVRIGAKTSYRDLPPVFGGIYYYWVRSRNGAGLSGFGAGLQGSSRSAAPGDLLWDLLLDSHIQTDPIISSDATIHVEAGDFYPEAQDNQAYTIHPGGWVKESQHLVPPGFESNGLATYLAIHGARIYRSPVAFGANGAVYGPGFLGSVFPPAIGPDGTVYVGVGTNLHAARPGGTLLWTFPIFSGAAAGPVIGPEGTIYIRGGETTLHAVSPRGERKWEFSNGSTILSSPAVSAEGTIYIELQTNFCALNPSGSIKWTFGTFGNVDEFRFYSQHQHSPGFYSPAIGSDGVVYLAFNTNLFALDGNGRPLWTFNVPEGFATAPTISDDGVLYIGGRRTIPGAKLYAIKVSTGSIVHPWPMYGHDPQHTSRTLQRALSAPRISNNGDLSITLTLEPGRTYRVEASTDLTNWMTVTNFVSREASMKFLDSLPRNGNAKFYRLATP